MPLDAEREYERWMKQARQDLDDARYSSKARGTIQPVSFLNRQQKRAWKHFSISMVNS
jgi:hypothetical protein